jgi:hypothetical protein
MIACLERSLLHEVRRSILLWVDSIGNIDVQRTQDEQDNHREMTYKVMISNASMRLRFRKVMIQRRAER